MASSSSCTRSWKYDVFLSFRGEDTRKTFVDHLYSALEHHRISTYKDDATLPRGDTIGPSLMKAIEESQIAVVVFSENYADSSWCLEELEHIMKCRHEGRQIVFPVFYNVDPSHVRKQKRKYEEAFSNHVSKKIESWRKALVDASNIAGWETQHIANGHEAAGIKTIVDTILDKLLSVSSAVDKKLVGMGSRFLYLESELQIGSGGVSMIGIWGVGGGGKTTFAFSIYMKIRDRFHGHCFIGNIREETEKYGLQKLQEKVLSQVLKKQVSVASAQEGGCIIENMLGRRNVLIILDDVDDVEQLEALAGSHNWFGDGSRIIITTRDEHVLISHRVDVVYPISLLSQDEVIRLFRRYAYCENNPVEDYDKLSFRVIYYVKGLPLALKIIGSFLYGKDKNEWISALDKLREIPNRKVTDQLKISYDGLDHDEKELFLDIACFFRRCSRTMTMKVLDASGFHPHIGIQVLIQKSLLTISNYGYFEMHDLVQEMGHHIVRGEHPNNPEKHSRVWRSQDIEDMCAGNATTENHKIEAIQYLAFESQTSPGFTLFSNFKKPRSLDDIPSQKNPPTRGFMTLVSNLKKLRYLCVYGASESSCDEGPTFLSNELRCIKWERYPASVFPESFQPRKLAVLEIENTLQKELWKGNKYMPCLKELKLTSAKSLVRIPDIGGLSCLQKLIVVGCKSLEEIHHSLGNHTSLVQVIICSCEKLSRFPSIVRMEKLEILDISFCKALLEFPKIEANMDSLVNLHLRYVGIEVLPSSVGRYCTNLISLKLDKCSKLKSINGNFHALKHLQKFELANCTELQWLPKDLFDEKCCLEDLCFHLGYWKLENLPISPPHLPRLLRKLNLSGLRLEDGNIPYEIGELSNLQELNLRGNNFTRFDFSLSQLTRLKLLNLSDCYILVELPELPSSLSILYADYCFSIEAIRDDVHRNCNWLCQVSITKSLFEGRGNLVGGERLLKSMLQGMVIDHHQCMSLRLDGIVIPKGFQPHLVRGKRCRVKLAENWFSENTGFLCCCVFKEHFAVHGSVKITMRNGMGISQDEQQVFWEEEKNLYRRQSYRVGTSTWVGYFSFGSLRSTEWWDQTSTSLDFSIDILNGKSSISGFGVRLVSKKNQMKEMTTTTNFPSEFSDDDYKCRYKIHHDSISRLECQFEKPYHPLNK